MATKTAQEKAIEKQISEEKKHAQEAARRDRAKAIVDASQYIGEFRVMNAEAEILLETALDRLEDKTKYVVSIDKTLFSSNIYDNFALICEELQQYGMITAYMLAGSFVRLTLSEAGKSYFQNKANAERSTIKKVDGMRYSIFISHRTVDANIADMIKDYLVNTGIPNEKIFCSSLPGNDVNEKIAPEVKQRLKECTIIIAILSRDYYDSAYCLNEAGVAWYLDEVVTIPIGLPEISHDNMIGFLNSDYKIRRLDNNDDISYLYDTAHERLNSADVKHGVITRETEKLKDRYRQFIETRDKSEVEVKEEDDSQPTKNVVLEKDEGILLVYAADDPSGQIMIVNSMSKSGPTVSTHKWEFNKNDTARESARWKRALENLEKYGFVEAANYKRQVFVVTELGYKIADQARLKWDVETSNDPARYIEQ